MAFLKIPWQWMKKATALRPSNKKKASGPKSKNKSTISHCELWPCTTKRYWIKFH